MKVCDGKCSQDSQLRSSFYFLMDANLFNKLESLRIQSYLWMNSSVILTKTDTLQELPSSFQTQFPPVECATRPRLWSRWHKWLYPRNPSITGTCSSRGWGQLLFEHSEKMWAKQGSLPRNGYQCQARTNTVRWKSFVGMCHGICATIMVIEWLGTKGVRRGDWRLPFLGNPGLTVI